MSIRTESSFILIDLFPQELFSFSKCWRLASCKSFFLSMDGMGGPIQVSLGKMDWDEVQGCAKFGLFIVHNILCYCGRAGSFEYAIG
eukprot:scaffold14338_cov176-Skeletonema_marinoi.AAC.3